MGIYSDSCEKCGYKVKKRARYCSRCGTPAPGGWIKCYNCSQWIGNESEYCPHCNAHQNVGLRNRVENGLLMREKGYFIQRFELDKLVSRLENSSSFTFEEGNIGFLMHHGKIVELIRPDKYTISQGVLFPFTSYSGLVLLLVGTGDMVFPYTLENSSILDGVPVKLYTEIILKPIFNKTEKSLTRLTSCLTESGLTYSDFWSNICKIIDFDSEKILKQLDIHEFIQNPDIRIEFEDKLKNSIQDILNRENFELLNMSSATFSGKAYDDLCRAAGERELQVREAVAEQRASRIIDDHKRDKIKSEQELKSYIDKLAFEYDINRLPELNKLELFRMELGQKLKLKKVEYQNEVNSLESEYNRQEDIKQTEHNIRIEEKLFEHNRSHRKKELEDEIAETVDWLKIRELKDAHKLKSEEARMKVYSKFNLTELAAVLPPDQVDSIRKLRRSEAKSELDRMEQKNRGK